MIPIQIKDSERSALKLLKPAIESALHEAGIEIEIPAEYTGVRGFYDHNLKINKLAYAAIEHFELPLVRTWYKYGQYEPYEELRPKSLEVGDHQREAYVPSQRKTDVTQERIKGYLLDRDLNTVFEQELFEFLTDNYEEWNPVPYTDVYLASTKIIRVMEVLDTLSSEEVLVEIADLREELKQASIDLRYEFESIPTFSEEIHSHTKNYLLSLEEALVKIDETSEITDNQLETIQESRKVYHQYVWPWAALNISLDKAKGPKESVEDFKSSGRDMVDEDKKSYDTHLKGWNADLADQNLKPSAAQHQAVHQPTPEAIKKLQRAALENS